MKFEEAINHIIKSAGAHYFSFNVSNYKIQKNTPYISSTVEHAQILKIIEKLDEFNIKYELELNGEITILK